MTNQLNPAGIVVTIDAKRQERRANLKRECSQFRLTDRLQLERVLKVGAWLNEEKEVTAHGEWGKFLEDIRISTQHASDWMRLQQIQDKFPDLGISDCASVNEAIELERQHRLGMSANRPEQPPVEVSAIDNGYGDGSDNWDVEPDPTQPPEYARTCDDDDSYASASTPPAATTAAATTPSTAAQATTQPSANGTAAPPMCRNCRHRTAGPVPDCPQCAILRDKQPRAERTPPADARSKSWFCDKHSDGTVDPNCVECKCRQNGKPGVRPASVASTNGKVIPTIKEWGGLFKKLWDIHGSIGRRLGEVDTRNAIVPRSPKMIEFDQHLHAAARLGAELLKELTPSEHG